MLAIRLEPDLQKKLEALAKSQGKPKSEIVREALRRYLDAAELVSEARRQSLLVSAHDAESEAGEFVEQAADLSSRP